MKLLTDYFLESFYTFYRLQQGMSNFYSKKKKMKKKKKQKRKKNKNRMRKKEKTKKNEKK